MPDHHHSSNRYEETLIYHHSSDRYEERQSFSNHSAIRACISFMKNSQSVSNCRVFWWKFMLSDRDRIASLTSSLRSFLSSTSTSNTWASETRRRESSIYWASHQILSSLSGSWKIFRQIQFYHQRREHSIQFQHTNEHSVHWDQNRRWE
jgi:hypothetical protein